MKFHIGGREPGALVARWVRDFGDGEVAAAHYAAMRFEVADYVPWMQKRLQSPKRPVEVVGNGVLDAHRLTLERRRAQQAEPVDPQPEDEDDGPSDIRALRYAAH
jgi:hypothetical protein